MKDEATHRVAFGDKKPGWGDAHREQLLDLIHAIRHDTEPLMNGPAARVLAVTSVAAPINAANGRLRAAISCANATSAM